MVREDVPWQEVRSRYERGEGTYRSLAEEYGVARSTLERRALVENWRGRRRSDSVDRTGKCLYSAAQQLLQCVEETLSAPRQATAAKELKELTGVLRELMQLRSALEQQLYDAAEQRETSPAVRVVLQGEVEEWSR